ncbi:MAG: NUDIX domain-containing protein [Dongiaceae bacterium]
MTEAPAARTVRPVDAAGLVLIRQGSGEPELLMGRRHRRHVFMPNIYVFPGGRLDPADRLPSGFPEALPPATAAGLHRGAGRREPIEFARAAVRETLEETGLLVGAPDAAPCDSDHPAWGRFARQGLAPAFAALGFVCRAITPTSSSRRYNTRFLMVDGALVDGTLGGDGELEDLAWRPAGAYRHLGLVDVTAYVLAEALARWQAPGAGRPAMLLSYRNEAMRLTPRT